MEFKSILLSGQGAKEVLRHGETGRDVVCAAFRSDGEQIVCGLLDGSLHFWDVKEAHLNFRSICFICNSLFFHRLPRWVLSMEKRTFGREEAPLIFAKQEDNLLTFPLFLT